MGKYLRRKQSYISVGEDHPGCIWAVFQMFNYHPWHNVRKMLPYKKHKSSLDQSTKSKGINPEVEHGINHSQELEEDLVFKHLASVNSGDGSVSKRSLKARIKAFMKEKSNSRELDMVVQEPEFQGHKNKCDDDDCAPSLLSLLKANPKLIKSTNQVDVASNMNQGTNVKQKDSNDFVGVLELYKVDYDLFLRVMQDSPPRKLKLVKCGTFPSLNPCNFETRQTKVEQHKYNEVWPVSGNARVLQKAKSQGIARSSSITDYSLDKFGYLFDTSSNKAIKKHLSKSLRLKNDKDFGLLNDLQGQRSFKERDYLSESESHLFTSNEPSRASLKRWNNTNYGEMKLRHDSPREVESPAESQTQRQSFEEQFDAMAAARNRETNLEGCSSQKDEIEIVDWPISEESPSVLISPSSISRNLEEETQLDDQFSVDYQYVKYVIDIAGLATTENQCDEWHSQTQPLDPALFDGIEVCCPFEPKSSDKDTIFISRSNRKVVFDLINEALIDIHERSNVYYPKALLSGCHVCPTRNGKRLGVGQVWKYVGEYLSWRAELDPSLDVAVSHDLSKDKNGWLNLQTDAEGLGLELEDLIFNELLDEIVCY
ncbi:protein TRM32 [Spinacia oleracea]|uniref:Protein TRM32 n=1 Tax=Spinacia oleracea TaxID=3562 RepID=A0A9R0I375_SPIOL|nr:protein TRM32 [Spinacia oleracea]